jgi:hypothetical protein
MTRFLNVSVVVAMTGVLLIGAVERITKRRLAPASEIADANWEGNGKPLRHRAFGCMGAPSATGTHQSP